MIKNGMTLTREELNTVFCVFYDLKTLKYDELNSFIGSETIKRMNNLCSKIHANDYCIEHGITFEDMTEDDWMSLYHEEYDF